MAIRFEGRSRLGALAAAAFAATLATLAAVTFGGYLSLSDARDRSATADRARREISQDALRFASAIGYGGFIHHYLEYVRRPKDLRQRAAAQRDYDTALELLNRIERNANRLGLEAPLSGLRATLGEYAGQLDSLVRLQSMGLGLPDNGFTPVSDDVALSELSGLLVEVEHASVERDAVSSRLRRMVILGSGALVLGGFGAILLIAQMRRGRRERGRLERMVGERTAIIEEHRERLEKALEREKALNGLQRQFVSMVSHEFRTPLAIMDAKARQLHRRADRLTPEDAHKASDTICRSVKRLVDLIECVLAASQLEEGKIAFSPRETDLAEILRDAGLVAGELYPDRIVQVDVAPELAKVTCDPILMRQVVSNLLSNAGKYTDPEDRITLTGARDPASGEIRISVEDTGIGIPEAELAKISDRFYRASTGVGRPGVGIGMHIVSNFVALHGGRLEVTSRVGEGSCFTVAIPGRIARPEEAASSEVEAASLPKASEAAQAPAL